MPLGAKMKGLKTLGSLCSGIEVASLVFNPLGVRTLWMSEIADFPSRLLAERFPGVPNLGDMTRIADLIDRGEVEAPDIICGGTPCQAFSMAGWRNGTDDDRGRLTLKYIDIIDAADRQRRSRGLGPAIFLWENVEGVLTDKTNAFGCFLAGLLGAEKPLEARKWPSAGIVRGKGRNVAWRVLDAKYFGVPQQRRRVYLLGGGSDFAPWEVLFERCGMIADPLKARKSRTPSLFDEEVMVVAPAAQSLVKEVGGHRVEAFRSYTDCLYAAYGTKWNGNAAAFNGSLFLSQDGRLRRLTPLECERLMGLPDNYTLLPGCRDTQRYRAVGNSWAVPVVGWLARRLLGGACGGEELDIAARAATGGENGLAMLRDFTPCGAGRYVNASAYPADYRLASVTDIADPDAAEKFYISARGCAGILRRKREHNAGMPPRLEEVLESCSEGLACA